MEPYLIFAGAFLLTAGAPGADTMLILSRTLVGGAGSAIRYALGITLAKMTAVAISFYGISAVLAANAQLFLVLKILGAGFLLFMAYRTWTTTPKKIEPKSNYASVLGGFTVGISNPQPLLFYTAIIPTVVNQNLLVLLVIVAAGFALITAVYVLLAKSLKTLIKKPINKYMAVVFVILAAVIAFR